MSEQHNRIQYYPLRINNLRRTRIIYTEPSNTNNNYRGLTVIQRLIRDSRVTTDGRMIHFYPNQVNPQEGI
jgi:hypothetical protein